MVSGVDFAVVDTPQANRLTIHILAAIAEHEATPSPSARRPSSELRSREGRIWTIRAGKVLSRMPGCPEPLSLSPALLTIMQNRRVKG